MSLPVCPIGCEPRVLPTFGYSRCNPKTQAGGIPRIYMASIGYQMTDWTSAVEWNARISNSSSAFNAIRQLTVTSELPAPESSSVTISDDRVISTTKDRKLPFTSDEMPLANIDAFRELECGGQKLVWFQTTGGLLFGGNSGIPVSIIADLIIPRSNKEVMTIQGNMTWSNQFLPDAILSPISTLIDA